MFFARFFAETFPPRHRSLSLRPGAAAAVVYIDGRLEAVEEADGRGVVLVRPGGGNGAHAHRAAHY